MSVFRDELEQCPRCGTELVDAGAARACTTCSGLWIGVADLQEMAIEMQTPSQPVSLGYDDDPRPPIACPTCKEAMLPVRMGGVAIDVCGKSHGIWFDATELATVLLRSVRKPT